ncbi:hypothetical protein [Bartonella bovis]|uniref:Surface protein/Bartonella adhesin n=1 Tax=Bartonella bovis m02 TaxID=1094492 RepID=N6VHI7_9HYPH|nr:hypothetical protein [Bartonella bovis]ENN93265.1 surface protein/Bartonella adhesin [Bartonella bovis m02]
MQDGGSKLITIGKDVDGDEISLVNKDAEVRVLSGVAEGDLSKDSTDAVTGKQLYKTTQTVTGLTSTVSGVEKNITDFDAHLSMYLGGGADVLKGTAPTYTIQDKKHNNIASAFEGVDSSLEDLSARVDDATGKRLARAEDNQLVVQDGGSKLITIGKDVDGDEISLVNKDAEVRVLSGVAEGDLSKDSTDAVTGKQLYKTTQTVTGLTSTVSGVEKNITDFDAHLSMYLGGGADVLKGTAPTYTIQDKKHNNIASAFEGVDSSLEDLSARVDDATAQRLARAEDNQLVVQDGGSKLITIGKDVDGDEISLVNKDAEVRVLSGVAEGDLSKDSTDAVTGKQLYKTTQTVTGLTSTVSGVEKNITDFDAHLSMYLGGGADVLKGTAPTYTIQDKKHNNIASAFEGVDSSLEDLSARVDDATAQRLARAEDNQLVVQDGGSKLITIGKDVDGDEISLVNKDAEVRVLSGVAEGDLSKDSTDAVTGKQLYKTTQTVTGLTSTVSGVEKNITDFDAHLSMYLGGGADVLKGTAPTYTIQDKKHNNIASAFEGVDSSLEDLSARVDDATAQRLARAEDNQLVVQDGGSKLITIGKDVDGDEISLVNKDAEVRVLSGVAEGDLSKDSTDAVTGKQLYKTTQTVTGLTSTVSGVEKNITDFDAHLSMYLGGGADVLKGTAPTYTIQDKKHNNIASAFEGVDSSLEDLSARVDDATAQRLARAEDNQLVVQDGGSKLITIGKDVDGDEISLVNKDAEVRVLSGVAEGDLSKDSTDAVTGKQLYKTTQTVTGLTSTVSGVEKNITDFDAHLSMYLGGGADVLNGKAPTYTIQDKKHNNIASAFEGVDSSLEDLSARVDDATAQRLARAEDNQLVMQDGGSKLITIGKDVDGDEISLVNKDAEVRVLSGVAEGDLSKDSTDAVTGKQLYKTTQTVTGLTSTVSGVEKNITDFDAHLSMYLGGGADVLKGTAPTYTIQDKKHNNIASAFEGVDSSLEDLSARVDDATAQRLARAEDNQLVVQDGGSKLITIGKDVDGDEISLVNKDAEVRVLSGVAEGDLSKDSTDAVTGKQLYKTTQTVTGLTSTVSGVEKNITDFDAHLSMYLGGGADVLKGTAPTYTIQDKKHNNIASAFEGVDSSLEDLSARVDDATAQRLARAEDNQLVVQDGGSKLITIGKDVDGDEISLVNKDAEVRVLSGVAEGDLSKDSTDAVTGKQLYKTTQTVTGLTSTVSGVEKNITDFDAHLSMYLGGGADVLKGTAPTYTIQDKKA